MFSLKYIVSISLLCGIAMLQTGCSISYSLDKSSDSVSASLDSLTSLTSISTSSSGGEEERVTETATIYEEDIAAITVLYASREKNNEEYQRQITRIAKNHGIGDWEKEPTTYKGMGMGLRRAGVAEDSILNMPYFRPLSTTSHFDKVLEGYRM